MRAHKFIILLLTLFVFIPALSFAQDNAEKQSIEFFTSNNMGEIDLKTAFNRLKGAEQQELQNGIIDVIQKNHVAQGKFDDILGTYRMSSNQKITADNSEIFITSPYQKLSTEKIFNLAEKLDNALQQESTAVFISSKQPIVGEVILKFKSRSYSISDTVKLIHEKLPLSYSQAFPCISIIPVRALMRLL